MGVLPPDLESVRVPVVSHEIGGAGGAVELDRRAAIGEGGV
jgi:hypothetical protein